MARGTTLIKLIDDLRAEARLSQNPAHNAQARDAQMRQLQRVQEWLWADFTWPHLRVERQIPIVTGQRYYDLPDDLDVDRVEKAEIFASGTWVPLYGGIDGRHYAAFNSDLDQRSWPPRAWKLGEGNDIELWPISDQDSAADTREGYLKLTGIRRLKPLIADGDRADLDDIMLVLYAAAEILAAAGSKDAQLKLDQANRRYARLRGNLTPRQSFQMFGVSRHCGPRSENTRVAHYTPPSET